MIPVSKEVCVTDTAKSKCFRLLSEKHIRNVLKGQAGTTFTDNDGQYLTEVRQQHKNRFVQLLWTYEDGKIVVITQRHRHENPYKSDVWERHYE